MRITFFVITLFFTIPTFAQGVFITPIVELSEVKDFIRLGYGGGAGIQLNRWLVGAYGIHIPKTTTDPQNLTLTFGGVWLEYQQPATSYLSVNVALKTAYGNAQQQFDQTTEDDRIWLFTPEAGVAVSIGKHVQLSYAAGYRIVGDLNLSELQNRDLYTLVSTLTLKIGRFKR